MKTLLLALAVAGSMLAGQLDGRWKAEWKTINVGTVNEYLELKTSGEKLSGSFIDAFGKPHEIRDGKVTANGFSFWMVWERRDGKEIRSNVTAMRTGDTLTVRIDTPGQPRTLLFKREKP
jgi:hypothetical protein